MTGDPGSVVDGTLKEAEAFFFGFVFAAGTLYSNYPNEGVDVAAIIASANENEAATKAARKNPAKAKK